jgi:hypothetical protein
MSSLLRCASETPPVSSSDPVHGTTVVAVALLGHATPLTQQGKSGERRPPRETGTPSAVRIVQIRVRPLM